VATGELAPSATATPRSVQAADTPGLCDELEARQLVDQLPRDVRALSDQHHDVGIAQADRQLAHALDGVGEDLGGVGFELLGAMQFAHGILIVVKDHDVHGRILCPRASW
jgi:hypothetical protein